MKTLTRRLPYIRGAIYGQPWAITEKYLEAICEMFEKNVAGVTTDYVKAMEDDENSEGEDAPFQTINGVAILPLRGPIFPRANLMTKMSGATSLEEYGSMFDQALESDCSAICMDIDSPGGSVSGLVEMSSKIYSASINSNKLILACISGLGASAAYMLASQANTVYATEGSLVGSIGVVAKYDDSSRQELNEGIDSTVIRSAPLKATGVGPISGEQISDMERLVEEYFEIFKTTVNKARPQVNMENAATGQVWLAKSPKGGDSAMSLGLIDGISTLAGVVSQYGSV